MSRRRAKQIDISGRNFASPEAKSALGLPKRAAEAIWLMLLALAADYRRQRSTTATGAPQEKCSACRPPPARPASRRPGLIIYSLTALPIVMSLWPALVSHAVTGEQLQLSCRLLRAARHCSGSYRASARGAGDSPIRVIYASIYRAMGLFPRVDATAL